MGLPQVGWSPPRELSITLWYSGLVLIRIPALEAILSKAEYVSFTSIRSRLGSALKWPSTPCGALAFMNLKASLYRSCSQAKTRPNRRSPSYSLRYFPSTCFSANWLR